MSNTISNFFHRKIPIIKKFNFNGNSIIIECDNIAQQTEKTIVIRWNETVILVTLCISSKITSTSFLPLSVEFQDNLYSVGKIPGSFFKREGKPSEYCVLSARIIDRSIRNLFPKDFRNEIQIIVSPLSIDYSTDIRTIAMIGISMALNSSSLPIHVPFASVVIGLNNNKLLINPSNEQMQESKLELFLTGTEKEINMIEMGGDQIPEEKILEAIKLGHEHIKKIIKIQEEVLKEIKSNKIIFETDSFDSETLKNEIKIKFSDEIKDLIENTSNIMRVHKTKIIEKKVQDVFINDEKYINIENFDEKLMSCLWDVFKYQVRNYTITNKKRIDGRDFDTIRTLNAKIDYLPIVHGSAIFNRGQTQTLSILTLGPISDKQIIDNITTQDFKSFMHHYKALPYSIGQVAWLRGLSRREVGHGFLGEKALKWIIPTIDEFPYTIRIISEVLASNGSSSQGAICSATLSLLSAGVPIKASLGGIATGLIKDGDDYHLLSDIQAWEDFFGDMDFKVAGSRKGICSIQVDLKISGLPIDIIEKILIKSKKDRMIILDTLDNIIDKPRTSLSKHAIKFQKIKIDVNNIGKVVGPNGKNIKKIISDTDETSIDINDDGTIFIYHKNIKMIEKAISLILDGPKKPKIGDKLLAKTVKIMDFGVFVDIDDSGLSGLIHISKLSKDYVKDISRFIKIGIKVEVEVIDINDRGQISLKLLKKLN